MAARRRLTKENARLALEDSNRWMEAMRQLPDDVDAAIASGRVIELIDRGSYWLHRFGSDLPSRVIDATFETLRANPVGASKLMLLELSKHALPWEELTAILASLDRSYGWGSKQMKDIFRATAKRPEVLAAIQTAVVGDARAPASMLAVLVTDGSEASIDALLPVFTNENADWLLSRLKTHAAKSPSLEAMFEAVSARTAARNRRSPATEAISKLVGAPLDKASFAVTLNSTVLNSNNVPRYQGSLRVESDDATWWRVHLTPVDGFNIQPSTDFGEGVSSSDALKLGTCTFEALPAWLKRSEKTLGIRFKVSDPYASSLRGKKRDAIRDWLFSVSTR